MSRRPKSWKGYLSPRFLTSQVKENGIVWCLKAALRLFYWRAYRLAPVRRATIIIPSLRFLLQPDTQIEKRLLAVCDFRTSPYGVGELLSFREMTLMWRLEHNVDKIDMVWLCEPKNPACKYRGRSS